MNIKMSFKNIISDFMKLVCSKHDKNIKKDMSYKN